VGEFGRKTLANTFCPPDWQINEQNCLTPAHLQRLNNPTSVNDNQPINLYGSVAILNLKWHMGWLRTQFNSGLLNELKVQYQTVSRAERRVARLKISPGHCGSVFSAALTAPRQHAGIQLGGQRFTPEKTEKSSTLVNTTNFVKGRYNYYTRHGQYLPPIFPTSKRVGLTACRHRQPEPRAASRSRCKACLRCSNTYKYFIRPSRILNHFTHVTAMLGLRWDMTSYLTAGDYVVAAELGLVHRSERLNNFQPK